MEKGDVGMAKHLPNLNKVEEALLKVEPGDPGHSLVISLGFRVQLAPLAVPKRNYFF